MISSEHYFEFGELVLPVLVVDCLFYLYQVLPINAEYARLNRRLADFSTDLLGCQLTVLVLLRLEEDFFADGPAYGQLLAYLYLAFDIK